MAVSKTLKSLVETFYLSELWARGIYVRGHSFYDWHVVEEKWVRLRVEVISFICAAHYA